MCPWRGGGQRTQPRKMPHCLHPRSWPRSSAGKFSQGPRGTRVGTGAGFYGRKETKSSIPGSPGSRRQGAPVPQAASRTAALGSEALGGGRTIQAARTARPPAPHRSPRSDIGARGAGEAEGEWCPPLGSPLPARSRIPGRGAGLAQTAAASTLGERQRRGDERWGQDQGRAGPLWAEPGWWPSALPWRAAGVQRGAPAVPGASGRTQPPGAQSLSSARSPRLAHPRRPGHAPP